jgi:Predicted membrane protein
MKRSEHTARLTILALMTALLLILSFTPLGTIPIGPLSISMNMIPVAVSAVALGPVGGAITGGIFGLLSFLQCFGIGVPSGMGAILVGINPFLAFVQRFVPRLLDGFLLGFIYRGVKKATHRIPIAAGVTGFFSAFLNTAFFMLALVFLFGQTEYVQGLMNGRNILAFIVAFVGINAVVEMIAATIITAAVGTALSRTNLLPHA